jgi:uracil-DNA glycosylase
MQPLILGETPSRSGDRFWRYPLSGDVGVRLALWAGLVPEEEGMDLKDYGAFYWPLRGAYDLANVIERWPGQGRRGRGADWPLDEAHRGLNRLLDNGVLPRNRVIVCLGRRVLDLIVHRQLDFYRWVRFKGTGWQIAGIPHPSKLNRMYNDPAHVAAAGKTLRGAIKRAEKVNRG